jgi:hypothetical protein
LLEGFAEKSAYLHIAVNKWRVCSWSMPGSVSLNMPDGISLEEAPQKQPQTAPPAVAMLAYKLWQMYELPGVPGFVLIFVIPPDGFIKWHVDDLVHQVTLSLATEGRTVMFERLASAGAGAPGAVGAGAAPAAAELTLETGLAWRNRLPLCYRHKVRKASKVGLELGMAVATAPTMAEGSLILLEDTDEQKVMPIGATTDREIAIEMWRAALKNGKLKLMLANHFISPYNTTLLRRRFGDWPDIAEGDMPDFPGAGAGALELLLPSELPPS